MRYSGIILYSCTLIFNVFSLHFFINLTDSIKINIEKYPEISHLDGFSLCYLTLWTFIFQMFFMIVAIMDETSKLLNISIKTQNQLNRVRAVMYNTVLFPASLLVVTLFWSIWFIDRELIFPRILDSFFPMWLNHMLHTFIIFPVIIELLLPKQNNCVKFNTAAPVLGAIFIIYLTVYFSIYFRYGIWLYPVYQIMSWPQRCLFSLLQLCLALGYQFLGIKLQNAKSVQIKPKEK